MEASSTWYKKVYDTRIMATSIISSKMWIGITWINDAYKHHKIIFYN